MPETSRRDRLARRIWILPLPVDLVAAPLQPAGEGAGAGGERPEEEEADGVAGVARELERADEAQVHRVEQGEKQHRADARDDERGPEHPDHLSHELSFTMRQLARGSSTTMCQCPAGSSG